MRELADHARIHPEAKERLHVNLEIASPAHFIPVPPGWEDRSVFVERVGKTTYLHYDLYAQALAKVERGHAQDVADVAAMLDSRTHPGRRCDTLLSAYRESAVPLSGNRSALVLARSR